MHFRGSAAAQPAAYRLHSLDSSRASFPAGASPLGLKFNNCAERAGWLSWVLYGVSQIAKPQGDNLHGRRIAISAPARKTMLAATLPTQPRNAARRSPMRRLVLYFYCDANRQ